MLHNLLLSLVLLVATAVSLPKLPAGAMLVGIAGGQCPAGLIVFEFYSIGDGGANILHVKHTERLIAVNIGVLVYALRANGTIEIFNTEESPETPCDTLALFLGKKGTST